MLSRCKANLAGSITSVERERERARESERDLIIPLMITTRSVFLAHLSQRVIGELIGYSWSGAVRPSSSSVVVHNAQTASSPKPLCQSEPNFMWSLLG